MDMYEQKRKITYTTIREFDNWSVDETYDLPEIVAHRSER